MEDVKVFLPPEMNDNIEDHLEYGDSKSGWIRDACEQRLKREKEEERRLEREKQADRGCDTEQIID